MGLITIFTISPIVTTKTNFGNNIGQNEKNNDTNDKKVNESKKGMN